MRIAWFAPAVRRTPLSAAERAILAGAKRRLSRAARLTAVNLSEEGGRLPRIDLGIVVGGDGSILAAARRLRGAPVPLLGVHAGTFGFLTEIAPRDLPRAIPRLLRRQFAVDSRRMIAACVESKRDPGTGPASPREAASGRLLVNDLVLSARVPGRMIDVRVSISGERVLEFPGDGVLVSTPLGSTAYLLSAGGPIAHPGLDALILAPVCPHTLWIRPLVLPASETVEIAVARDGEGLVHGDGFVIGPVGPRDRVIVRRSRASVHLVNLGIRSPYARLREKLHWGQLGDGRP